MSKIVIAGGTGFLGTCLATHYTRAGKELIILTRGKTQSKGSIQYIHWDGKSVGPWATVLEGADVVINLNGKSVDCRYTERNKALIYETRLKSTEALGKAMLQCKVRPKLWINAASATIYRHSLDKEMDEYDGEIGDGFSVDVCRQWEAELHRSIVPGTRKILMRTGIVLGRNGGPMKPLSMLARLGFGGKQGTGTQYISWLHADDFVSVIDFMEKDEALSGTYNVTSPMPVPNHQFMCSLRTALKIALGIPLPRWILEAGAVLIGTETELVLKSRRVVPRKLIQAGYAFKHADIRKALLSCV